MGNCTWIRIYKKYPDLVSKYIGIGQFVNIEKNTKLQKELLKNKGYFVNETKYNKDITKLSLHLTKRIISFGRSLYGYKNYNDFVMAFLKSKDYKFKDKINKIRGSNQSIKFLWDELMEVNFEKDVDFKVPILFIEGRHDYHV